ncbi:hypothetical protein BV22DRAFT_1191249 [Leucogyrophana mollusca]|uniref:Uncharacterized protein n=1 Tax=Leucogyrophana mollusca TaxID=85980 RepID=A0ACB8BXN0_9AGAM|nr:hypothetical protein BV22DRAFT_1191249 [Leucogyrophana mollusca]
MLSNPTMGSMTLQASSTSTASFASVLKHAQSFLSLSASKVGTTLHHDHLQQHPPSITLPEPQPLLPLLLRLGASTEWAQGIDRVYQNRASELRLSFEVAVTHLFSKLVRHSAARRNASEEKITSAVSMIYRKQLADWEAEAAVMVKNHISKLPKDDSVATVRRHKSAPPFNQEYVPLLEHYFNENPFPTRADKDFLAKKSGMEYRQIHVWFQNRRNRTKKEGKLLKKKPMSEGATLPMDDLYARMEKYIIPENHHAPGAESDERQPSPDQMDAQNVLDGSAPPHAFPCAYPPVCEYNPFPRKDGANRFEAPQWFRRPSTAPITRPPTMSMTDFIEKFSQLHVRDGTSNRSRQNAQTTSTVLHTEANSFAASLTFAVASPPAPHPAFIPHPALTPASATRPLLAVSAPASRLHVFDTPSPQSRPATLVPVAETETPTRKKAGRRKVAALPRRVPQGTSIAHRGDTLAAPDVSLSSPSPSSSSRSASFGSESGHSRVVSTVSSSSDSSSRVVTPVSSSPSLPAQIFSPSLSLPGFSFDLPSNMSDLFGDSAHGSPSPVEGLQLDFQSSIFGHSGIVKPPSFNFSCGISPVSSLVTMRS